MIPLSLQVGLSKTLAAALMLLSLVLFRYFDIRKPMFIRDVEKLPRGWGVMADDVLAGIYAAVILLPLTLLVG